MTQMNLPMKQKQTHRYREQIGGCQGWWQVDGQMVQTSSYTINKSWGCNAQHSNYS